MDRIERQDESLAALAKPALTPTDTVSLTGSDCLVVCAGFEERAPRALRKAVATSHGFTVLVIDYLPAIAENRLDEIREICRAARLRVLTATYHRQNPSGFGATLLARTAEVEGRIFLDISAMSRLLIVQSIVALAGHA